MNEHERQMTNENHELAVLPPTGGNCKINYYPHLFRLLHWLLWPSLIVLALTGFSLHAIASPDWSLFKGVLPRFFWPGRVHFFHILASLVFSPALLAATWVYLRNRPPFRRTHVVLLFGSLALLLSGILLMTWPGPAAVYLTARWIHFLGGFFLLPIAFLWHALQGVTRYRRALVPAFHPWAEARWTHLLLLVPATLLTTCLLLSGLPYCPPWRDLTAKRIPRTDLHTAELDELPWEDDGVEPVLIELFGGLGFDGGQTQVTLRALHDGEELFILAEWDDPTEDRRDMPWRRTDNGWKRMVLNPDDETRYYEDKFSLIFPAEPDWQFELFGCALQCHAGGGREYGYKGCDRILDVWHWKSTRTDPCGQVDDKYWSKLDFVANKDVGRYADPKTGGGYLTNVSEDGTYPGWLPRDGWACRDGIIPTEQAVEYDSDEGATILTRIPEGAVIPGIVASAAEGDRGDVGCMSRHESGRWRLYIRRKLDTGHKLDDGRPSDARFEPGQSIPFGCAAFDHSSKRHAYGFPVYRLKLEQ
jgi:hypothetical protein